MHVLIVEDEPYLADVAGDGDGDATLELLSPNAHDIAVLEVLVAAEGGVVEPGIIATVAGVGYRIDTERSLSERADDTAPRPGPEGADRG